MRRSIPGLVGLPLLLALLPGGCATDIAEGDVALSEDELSNAMVSISYFSDATLTEPVGTFIKGCGPERGEQDGRRTRYYTVFQEPCSTGGEGTWIVCLDGSCKVVNELGTTSPPEAPEP